MKNRRNKLFYFIYLLSCFFMLGLTDPTLPPTIPIVKSNGSPSSSYKLNAVYIYETHRFALINNTVVRMGEQLDNFTITNITPYTVELTGSDGKAEQLQLAPTVKSESALK